MSELTAVAIPPILPARRLSTVWMDRAACRRLPRDTFFPGARHSLPAWAKRICAACPVQQQCLQWALSVENATPTGSGDGWYGGVSPIDRRRMLREVNVCADCAAVPPVPRGRYCIECAKTQRHHRYVKSGATG